MRRTLARENHLVTLPANYMFRNGYHLWYCSHILCSNSNSSSLSLSTCTPSHLPFLNCKLPEQSVVVLCRNFLRSARGWGDPTFSGWSRNLSEIQEVLAQKLIQRFLKLWLSDDEVGSKVHISRIMLLAGLMWYDILPNRRKLTRIPGLPVMYGLRIFSRRRYDLIELTDFHLNWTSSYEWLNLRYRTCQQIHRRRLYVRSRFI